MKILADRLGGFTIRGTAARLTVSLVVLLAFPWIAGAQAQTVVSLTFDDGIATQYTQGRAALVARGMHGTFYVNSGNVGANSYYMNWTQVSTLAADGNEIGGHTVKHQKLTNLTAAQQRTQICDDRTALQNRGFTVTDFAYPYGAGAHNSTTRSIVKDCGYASARMVGDLRDASDCGTCDYAETLPPKDSLAVRSNPYVSGAMTLARLQSWVTQAESHGGGWVPLMFHDICNGCDDASVSASDFGAFLDWLKARASKGTVVATVREALTGNLPPPPPSDTTPPATSISCNGAACPSTGLAAPVSIALSATDSGSGVSATRYTTNGSDPTQSSTAYTGPFSISQTTTIKFRSWDVAGNVEQVRSQTVTVTTGGGGGGGGGPTVTITSPAQGATVRGNITVLASASGSWTTPPDVDLYVDSNFTSWRTNETSPFQIPWSTGSVSTGSHTIMVFVEAGGTVTRSAPVTVTVAR
jgi:peptidoglycan/xylan/chitin deacetylase (PgdA/CDA1 family)